LDPNLFKEVEAVVNLAGENIGGGRWTAERKEKILSSRTKNLSYLLQSLPPTLKVLISASAVGYYGNRGNEALTESSVPGQGFLSKVCQQAEATAETAMARFPSARLVIFRCGVVFGPSGGALVKMLPPFRMNLGGVLGNGKQWLSWIHIRDLVDLFVKALEDSSMKGIYNAVAPEPVTNQHLTKELVTALNVHQGPPVPQFALKLLFGEMSSVLFDSQKVFSERLKGHPFYFPDLHSAIRDSLKK
jgi:hypothetical protein